MAIKLFHPPNNNAQRQANRKAFKHKHPIACPQCHTETKHMQENALHWFECTPCKDVFHVDDTGDVEKFCQNCSKWEPWCTCLPDDDC